jgi:hypothetical protein
VLYQVLLTACIKLIKTVDESLAIQVLLTACISSTADRVYQVLIKSVVLPWGLEAAYDDGRMHVLSFSALN